MGGEVTITYNKEPGWIFSRGVNTVTAIATDIALNKASCEFMIIVDKIDKQSNIPLYMLHLEL